MKIEQIPVDDLLEYLRDVIPFDPKGPSGPYTGCEVFAEVQRRLTRARAVEFEVAADFQLPLKGLFLQPQLSSA
ncbi:MAG: hypothetical protein Q7S86_03360 [bacterium]|nr:hypothetical protein [bacterium]